MSVSVLPPSVHTTQEVSSHVTWSGGSKVPVMFRPNSQLSSPLISSYWNWLSVTSVLKLHVRVELERCPDSVLEYCSDTSEMLENLL